MVAKKGHFDGKVVVLDEPADLSPGQEVIVQFQPATAEQLKPGDSLRWLVEHAVDDPSLPSDGSYQHDHYLYGTPKRAPLKP